MGGEEIFKGKWAERQMKQVTENILRNNSIDELEKRCPCKRQRNRQCHVSNSDIKVELTSISGPVVYISSESCVLCSYWCSY